MLPSIETIKPQNTASSAERYYERNALRYFNSTVKADLSALYERFLRYVQVGGRILDAGSGSGRDTLAFLKSGYTVDAFDSSPALAELSSRLTGIGTQVMRFEELEEVERYDGIWACAALLHVPQKQLPDVMARLVHALKHGGALYLSFKLGPGERLAEDGRFFTDMDELRLTRLIETTRGLALKEMWITGGEDSFKGQDTWVNVIAVKVAKT